jgi:hypothetical protein
MESSANGHGPQAQVIRLTSLTPGLIAAVLEFHKRAPGLGYTVQKSLDLLRLAMTSPTQVVLAVGTPPDGASVAGYAWMSLLSEEPVALLNQAWSRSPDITEMLHQAATEWAISSGATAIRAWVHPADVASGLRLYMRWGFVPRSLLVEKTLPISVLKLGDRREHELSNR